MSYVPKYRAKHMTVDGYNFDSVKEAMRYQQLKLMERAGVIHDLQMQVAFPLIKKSQYGREIKYIADFTYYEGDKWVVEDVKSSITAKNPVYRLKKRLLAETYGIRIKET